MAIKFKAGMLNFIEVLNQMWDAFAAGPYNALPLVGGNLTGPLTSTSSISAAGNVAANGYLVAGATVNQNLVHRIYAPVNEFGPILNIGKSSSSIPCVTFHASSGTGGWGSAQAVLYLGKNSTTGRSINAEGFLSASGADYAEYLIKGLLCGTIAPGQIVGIDADGRLTDKWDLAITFAVKSTNPCMVGGDTWTAHLGPRPGEGEDQTAFDVALEQARQKVDRIAFAGQVPVNLQGCTPGQFIVPVQDGDGIAGLAVDETGITLPQYMRAIGRVIAIEDDGRARIIVKVA